MLMRPRDRGPDPVPVEAASLLQRGRRSSRPRRSAAASCGSTSRRRAIGLGVLVLIVRRPPRAARGGSRRPVARRRRRRPRRSRSRPALAALPLAAVARERAKDVGLVTQDWPAGRATWPSRRRSARASPALGGARARVRHAPLRPRWWVPGAVVVVAFGAVTTYAGPVVLDPLFNKFKPLPQRRAAQRRARAGARGRRRRRRGLRDGRVAPHDRRQRVRRPASARPSGSCSTTTSCDDFTPAETRLVVAHELGHVHHHDVRNGLLWLAIVAPFGMWAVAALAERLAPRDGALGPRAVPAVGAVARDRRARDHDGLQPALARRRAPRRRVLARADRDPRTLIDFQRRIAVKNVSDPDPPGVVALPARHAPDARSSGSGMAEAFER